VSVSSLTATSRSPSGRRGPLHQPPRAATWVLKSPVVTAPYPAVLLAVVGMINPRCPSLAVVSPRLRALPAGSSSFVAAHDLVVGHRALLSGAPVITHDDTGSQAKFIDLIVPAAVSRTSRRQARSARRPRCRPPRERSPVDPVRADACRADGGRERASDRTTTSPGTRRSTSSGTAPARATSSSTTTAAARYRPGSASSAHSPAAAPLPAPGAAFP
jgi:hypothetical protein